MAIDYYILHLLNGNYSLFLDRFASTLTDGWTWIALYITLTILVIKNNKTIGQIFLIFGCGILGVLLAGGINDAFIKTYFMRLRPCLDPEVAATVHIVKDISVTGYSFFSSHAANTFSLAMFFTLLTRSPLLSGFLFSWATVNAWTRLYLGAHYFTDVVVGALWGLVAGIIVYLIYYKVFYMISSHAKYISTHYTKTGYAISDINMCVSILVFSFFYALFKTIIWYD